MEDNEFKLNLKQKKVIQADEPKILCLASAASGKTRTLTERIRYIITEKQVAPKDIVAITFTNQASQEMYSRLGEVGEEVFIGTLHSYANKICILNGIDTSDLIVKEQYDRIIKKALLIPRSRLGKIGYLFVDECQDLGELEFKFLSYLIKDNEYWTGDERQTIYGFKGSSDKYLYTMYYDKTYKKYFLNENYRNTPEIIEFADSFLNERENLSPQSIPMKTKNGFICHCSFNEALEELEESGNWKDWFIIARTNKEVYSIMQVLSKRKVPYITFKRGNLSLNQMKALMSKNVVKVMTIHAAKGLEAPNVIVVGALVYNSEERKISYVAATRAEQNLYWCPAFKKTNGASKKNGRFKKAKQGVVKF